mmetsp:Transcript_173/g.207  ORF Transcript_173/g.207 Transcript_173/m.207 type:complete len:143 (+) Transcript_173:895-1323(+)
MESINNLIISRAVRKNCVTCYLSFCITTTWENSIHRHKHFVSPFISINILDHINERHSKLSLFQRILSIDFRLKYMQINVSSVRVRVNRIHRSPIYTRHPPLGSQGKSFTPLICFVLPQRREVEEEALEDIPTLELTERLQT